MTVDLDELERLHEEARQPSNAKSTGAQESDAWNTAIWAAAPALIAELRAWQSLADHGLDTPAAVLDVSRFAAEQRALREAAGAELRDAGPSWKSVFDEGPAAQMLKLRDECSAARREAAKWKAAHDEMVSRNRLLRDRTDLERPRQHIYEEWTRKVDALIDAEGLARAEADKASDEIDRLRAALRAHGPCAAVRKDGTQCTEEAPCRGTDDHPHLGGEFDNETECYECWPDSDNDPVATAAREAEVRRALVEGGW